jgi:hypothetical protein
LLFITAAALLWVAILNGFPILYSDTGTYLAIGSKFVLTYDRPITYGLLIAPFYYLAGLWLVVIFQALLTAWIVALAIRSVIGRTDLAVTLLCSAVLAAFSSLPWFAGQIMPDLFTGLLPLLIFLLVFDGLLAKWERHALAAILMVATALHLSHVPFAVGLLIVSSLIARAYSLSLRGAFRAAAAIFIAISGLCSANFVLDGKFQPSLMTSTFSLARLLDAGLAQPILTSVCAERKMGLCAAQPLIAAPGAMLPGQAYLWDIRSPRRSLEHSDWHAIRAEEAMVVRRTIIDRPGDVIAMAVSGWGRQMVTAKTADGLWPCRECAPLIERYFPSEVSAWRASLQQKDKLRAYAVMPVRLVALIAAILSPIFVIVAGYRRDTALMGLALTILAAVIGNAAICGIFSGVYDRYQSRVLWLLPLLMVLAIGRIIDQTLQRRAASRETGA